MKPHRYPIVVPGWLAGLLLLVGIAPPAFGQASTAPPTDEANESLDVRYARAYLRLAKMDLQEALDVNANVPGTLPAAVIEPLRAVVAIAEVQLQYAIHGGEENLHSIHLAITEAKLKDAEDELQRGLAIKKRTPGMVSDTEIERLRLRVEVARLGLEKARTVNIHSSAEHLQWQVRELQKELLQLHSRVERLSGEL